jgi:hypothetical protein
MSEFNLTMGQAIDLMLQGKIVESEKGNKYHFSNDNFRNLENHSFILAVINSGRLKFREYIEPKEVKLVKWYHAYLVWDQLEDFPKINGDHRLWRSKEEYINKYKSEKVLEWKEFLQPDNQGDC